MRASSRMVFLVSWILECNHMADILLSGSHMVTRVEEKWFCAVSGKVLSHCGTGKSSSASVQPGMEAVWNVAWESSGMWGPVELVWDTEKPTKSTAAEKLEQAAQALWLGARTSTVVEQRWAHFLGEMRDFTGKLEKSLCTCITSPDSQGSSKGHWIRRRHKQNCHWVLKNARKSQHNLVWIPDSLSYKGNKTLLIESNIIFWNVSFLK